MKAEEEMTREEQRLIGGAGEELRGDEGAKRRRTGAEEMKVSHQ